MSKKQHSGSHAPAVAAERAHEGTECASGAAAAGAKRRRWTASRKFEAVICVVKGQSLDAVSRKYGIALSELSQWHKKFLSGAEELLKSKDVDDPNDSAKKELLAKIGEITMDNELLREKIRRLENGVPFHLRR
jgi:transposase-like protein